MNAINDWEWQRICVTRVVLVLVLMTAFAAAQSQRPNIVFLMSDDQCTYSLGCYGTPNVKTPHIDGLARDGMVFEKHYVSTAICMASRANVVTGMYEYKHGCNFTHGPLMRDHWEKSYPLLLREAGYRTAFAGKIGFEVADGPGQRSALPAGDFDAWGAGPGQTHYETSKNKSMSKYADEFPHSTLSYGAFGRDFIRDVANDRRPFCLSISFKAPHRPTTPDSKFDHVYTGVKFQKPGNYGRRYGEHFSKQSRQGRQYERFHSWEYSTNYDAVMATYYQQIYAVDVAVGMIRTALVEAGVAENTIVIFTSDNGFMCGSHGYGSKVLPYEESSRVPLVIYDPRHENSGKRLRCRALTGNIDMAPTMLDYAGVQIPGSMDGVTLKGLYSNPRSSVRQSLTLINVWGPRPVYSLSVVTRDWKYINWPYAEQGFQPTEELYHLSEDPLELTDQAGRADVALATMQQKYDDAVRAWSRDVVSYNHYEGLDEFFERKSR